MSVKRNIYNSSFVRRFSATSKRYDSYATIQKRVASQLMHLFGRDLCAKRILEVGCGSGQLTEMLIQQQNNAMIEAVDVSEAMIKEARLRLGGKPQVTFKVADACTYKSPYFYDTIFSSSALQWAVSLGNCMRHLRKLLQNNGIMICAVMIDGTLGELRAARLRIAPHKRPHGRLPGADDIFFHLKKTGLHVIESCETEMCEVYESTASFLKIIHNQGVTGGDVSRASLPLNRSEIKRLIEDYESNYHIKDGGVIATYKVLYFKAGKWNNQ